MILNFTPDVDQFIVDLAEKHSISNEGVIYGLIGVFQDLFNLPPEQQIEIFTMIFINNRISKTNG